MKEKIREPTKPEIEEIKKFRDKNPNWLKNERYQAIHYLAWFVGLPHDTVEKEIVKLEKAEKVKNKK